MPMKAEHVTGAKKESGKGAIAPIRYLSALVHLTTLARTRKQSTRRQFYMSLANSHGITSEFSSDPTPFRWIPGQVSSLLFAYFAETVVAKFFYPFLPKAIASLLLSYLYTDAFDVS